MCGTAELPELFPPDNLSAVGYMLDRVRGPSLSLRQLRGARLVLAGVAIALDMTERALPLQTREETLRRR